MEKKRADSKRISSRKEASHIAKDKTYKKEKTSNNEDKKTQLISGGTSARLKLKKPINKKEEKFAISDPQFEETRQNKYTPAIQSFLRLPLGSESKVESNELNDFFHIAEWGSLNYSAPPEIPTTSSAIDPQEMNHKNTSIPSMEVLASEFADLQMAPKPPCSRCRNCNNQIVFDVDLMKLLLEPINRQRRSSGASPKSQSPFHRRPIHNESSSRRESVKSQSSSHKESLKGINFQCGICGFRVREGSIRQHMNDHILGSQIFYCLFCQKDIDTIAISALSEPHYKDQFLRRISLNSQFIETRKNDLPNCRTPDASVQPKCGKCNKIFDYIGPLLQKLLDCNVKVYEIQDGSLSVDTCIICCLCQTAGDSISAMQRHVLEHVRIGDGNCRVCHEESRI